LLEGRIAWFSKLNARKAAGLLEADRNLRRKAGFQIFQQLGELQAADLARVNHNFHFPPRLTTLQDQLVAARPGARPTGRYPRPSGDLLLAKWEARAVASKLKSHPTRAFGLFGP
jgi:hypothetical protein